MMEIQTRILLEDDRLTTLLTKIRQGFSQAGIGAILQETGRQFERITVLPYPTATGAPLPKRYRWSDGTLSKFQSYQHQRRFFGALKAGKFSIRYRRTGKLARSLRFTPLIQGLQLLLTISVPDNYRFTVGEQSLYFKHYTNWKTLEATVTALVPRYTETAVQILENILGSLGNAQRATGSA